MAEYIERDVAVKTAMTLFAPVNTATQAVIESSLRSKFNSIPAADVAPVVCGRWEKGVVIQTDTSTLYDYTCSECSIVTSRESNYCPNCGAKMDGKSCVPRMDGEVHDPVAEEVMQEEDRAREREMQSMWL